MLSSFVQTFMQASWWDRQTARQLFAAFMLVILMAGSLAALGRPAATKERELRRATPGVPLLWGQLTPGPYSVGFRTGFRFDRSRTWLKGTDTEGRPIRVEVWYPARVSRSRRLRFGDYIHVAAPRGFGNLEKVLEQRDETLARLSVGPNKLPALLSTEMFAQQGAPPSAGRYPVVIYFGGMNDTTTAGVILAEYLASHGFVVLSVPLLGIDVDDPNQHRTQADLEASVRDAEFAWSALRSESHVDGTRLGVIGHSLGGVEAVLLAMRNTNVRAVVGLDGTYGFAGATQVLTGFYGYAPQRMHAPLLDLRKVAGEQDTVLDLSALNDFHYADRTLVSITKIHHSDFASFGMIADVFGLGNDPGYVDPSGWTRATGAQQFQHTCAITADFLEEQLSDSSNAADRMARDVANAFGGTSAFHPGVAPPPLPAQLITMAARQGTQAVDAIIDRYRREVPIDWVVEERLFNTLGYNRLAAHQIGEAIAAFRINAYAHPKSANAFDSLADGYIAEKSTDLAIDALQQAIEAAKDDPSLAAAAREPFISAERTKLEHLKIPK